jgi:hypothetical protein
MNADVNLMQLTKFKEEKNRSLRLISVFTDFSMTSVSLNLSAFIGVYRRQIAVLDFSNEF